jgi:integrase
VNGRLERVPGDGWKEALDLYRAQADDLHLGRIPCGKSNALLVKDLCNRFLTTKTRELASGEIGRRMFEEYRVTTDRLIAQFGRNRLVEHLTADDFEALRAGLANHYGPVRLCNEIQKVKTVMKYAFDRGLIDRPVRYGSFKKPSMLVLRRHRAKNGSRMLEADECRKLLSVAPVQLKAMLLLGLNCGFGNADCAALSQTALNLDTGWVDFPRPKSGIERRCPLWPETVAALRAALAERRDARTADAKELVFITARGRSWLNAAGIANPVSHAIRRLMRQCGVHRAGLGGYTMRHVFRTVADSARDPVAIDLIMGHSDHTMGAVYRERVDDARLDAVVAHVRRWLWPEA